MTDEKATPLGAPVEPVIFATTKPFVIEASWIVEPEILMPVPLDAAETAPVPVADKTPEIVPAPPYA